MAFKKEFGLTLNSKHLSNLLMYLDDKYVNVAFFKNAEMNYPHGEFDQVIYAGNQQVDINDLNQYMNNSDVVGLIGYDYKNQIENLNSQNFELLDGLQDSIFFVPELTIKILPLQVQVHATEPIDLENIISSIYNIKGNSPVKITSLTSKEEYVKIVNQLKTHIINGDIYEINYCQAFTFTDLKWNPIFGFEKLTLLGSMPFSVYFKHHSTYLLGASPERFLKKEGKSLIAQPIKGTIKRGQNLSEDEFNKEFLRTNEKEKAENLMIVDLMRNDLSKISKTGTVQVEELFGIYPFPNVFQMISTITSELNDNVAFKDIIHATFPMGSMTGAPKIKSMELIEQYEDFKRSWFSGSIGYIKENGDFDFNVIIRSLIYDKKVGKGYFAVGSAITYDANPIAEYEECLLKAGKLIHLLTQ
jgi:para-aminobenzoate synthetase component I